MRYHIEIDGGWRQVEVMAVDLHTATGNYDFERTVRCVFSGEVFCTRRELIPVVPRSQGEKSE